MTKRVFNWPAMLGLMAVAMLVGTIVPTTLIYLEIIQEDSRFIVSMLIGLCVGLAWPFPAFTTR